MKIAQIFQWAKLDKDIPDSQIQKGDRGVILEHLKPTKKQKEPGYTIEVFKEGETLDVISVPVSWVTPLPEIWGEHKA